MKIEQQHKIKIGHNNRKRLSKEQRLTLQSHQYKRMMEEKRGHNYQYYSEELQKYMDNKGYVIYPRHGFNNDSKEPYITSIENDVQIIVNNLR